MGSYIPSLSALFRITRRAARRFCDPPRRSGFLEFVPRSPGKYSNSGGPGIRSADGRSVPPFAALQEGRQLLVRAGWSPLPGLANRNEARRPLVLDWNSCRLQSLRRVVALTPRTPPAPAA